MHISAFIFSIKHFIKVYGILLKEHSMLQHMEKQQLNIHTYASSSNCG